MYIVDRDTFLQHPVNTVFSVFDPNVFGPLRIKGDSLIWEEGNDFCYQEIADSVYCIGSNDFHVKLNEAAEKGKQLRMDFDCWERDGCFEYEELYAVWDKQDVQQLIERLQECIK